jgi:hypothetical protein
MAKKAAKKGKRMADGGAAGVSDKMYREPGSKPANMPGRSTLAVMPPSWGRPTTGGELTNYPGIEGPGAGRGLGRPGTGKKPPSMGRPTTGGELPPVNDKFLRPGTQKTPAIMPEVATPMPRGGMRGGGLAKKGVGMALKKGGLVKGAGCAKRGVKKPRYT